MTTSEMSLYDKDGNRKYLCKAELQRFVNAAEKLPPRERAFCLAMAYTGGRIAEVLALRKQDVDRTQGTITIQSLKKRKKGIYRSVPVPPTLISTLALVFDLGRGKQNQRLWTVTVRQAYTWIMEAMKAAGLDGYSPRSLRHSFGVSAIMAGIPLTAVQKWLGHADLKTTSIYVNAMGEEERGLAARMWQ